MFPSDPHRNHESVRVCIAYVKPLTVIFISAKLSFDCFFVFLLSEKQQWLPSREFSFGCKDYSRAVTSKWKQKDGRIYFNHQSQEDNHNMNNGQKVVMPSG